MRVIIRLNVFSYEKRFISSDYFPSVENDEQETEDLKGGDFFEQSASTKLLASNKDDMHPIKIQNSLEGLVTGVTLSTTPGMDHVIIESQENPTKQGVKENKSELLTSGASKSSKNHPSQECVCSCAPLSEIATEKNKISTAVNKSTQKQRIVRVKNPDIQRRSRVRGIRAKLKKSRFSTPVQTKSVSYETSSMKSIPKNSKDSYTNSGSNNVVNRSNSTSKAEGTIKRRNKRPFAGLKGKTIKKTASVTGSSKSSERTQTKFDGMSSGCNCTELCSSKITPGVQSTEAQNEERNKIRKPGTSYTTKPHQITEKMEASRRISTESTKFGLSSSTLKHNKTSIRPQGQIVSNALTTESAESPLEGNFRIADNGDVPEEAVGITVPRNAPSTEMLQEEKQTHNSLGQATTLFPRNIVTKQPRRWNYVLKRMRRTVWNPDSEEVKTTARQFSLKPTLNEMKVFDSGTAPDLSATTARDSHPMKTLSKKISTDLSLKKARVPSDIRLLERLMKTETSRHPNFDPPKLTKKNVFRMIQTPLVREELVHHPKVVHFDSENGMTSESQKSVKESKIVDGANDRDEGNIAKHRRENNGAPSSDSVRKDQVTLSTRIIEENSQFQGQEMRSEVNDSQEEPRIKSITSNGNEKSIPTISSDHLDRAAVFLRYLNSSEDQPIQHDQKSEEKSDKNIHFNYISTKSQDSIGGSSRSTSLPLLVHPSHEKFPLIEQIDSNGQTDSNQSYFNGSFRKPSLTIFNHKSQVLSKKKSGGSFQVSSYQKTNLHINKKPDNRNNKSVPFHQLDGKLLQTLDNPSGNVKLQISNPQHVPGDPSILAVSSEREIPTEISNSQDNDKNWPPPSNPNGKDSMQVLNSRVKIDDMSTMMNQPIRKIAERDVPKNGDDLQIAGPRNVRANPSTSPLNGPATQKDLKFSSRSGRDRLNHRFSTINPQTSISKQFKKGSTVPTDRHVEPTKKHTNRMSSSSTHHDNSSGFSMRALENQHGDEDNLLQFNQVDDDSQIKTEDENNYHSGDVKNSTERTMKIADTDKSDTVNQNYPLDPAHQNNTSVFTNLEKHTMSMDNGSDLMPINNKSEGAERSIVISNGVVKINPNDNDRKSSKAVTNSFKVTTNRAFVKEPSKLPKPSLNTDKVVGSTRQNPSRVELSSSEPDRQGNSMFSQDMVSKEWPSGGNDPISQPFLQFTTQLSNLNALGNHQMPVQQATSGELLTEQSNEIQAESLSNYPIANLAISTPKSVPKVTIFTKNFMAPMRREVSKRSQIQMPEMPDTPDTPEPPATPKVPNTPQTPNMPKTPKLPQTPQMPEVPQTPGAPNTPQKPDKPKMPQTPEKPNAPEMPQTPQAPSTPETPETPRAPETPAKPQAPETPAKPQAPEAPQIPGMPQTPDTPETPQTAQTPQVPNTPEMPQTPQMPEVPKMPKNPQSPQTSGISTMSQSFTNELPPTDEGVGMGGVGKLSKQDKSSSTLIPGQSGADENMDKSNQLFTTEGISTQENYDEQLTAQKSPSESKSLGSTDKWGPSEFPSSSLGISDDIHSSSQLQSVQSIASQGQQDILKNTEPSGIMNSFASVHGKGMAGVGILNKSSVDHALLSSPVPSQTIHLASQQPTIQSINTQWGVEEYGNKQISQQSSTQNSVEEMGKANEQNEAMSNLPKVTESMYQSSQKSFGQNVVSHDNQNKNEDMQMPGSTSFIINKTMWTNSSVTGISGQQNGSPNVPISSSFLATDSVHQSSQFASTQNVAHQGDQYAYENMQFSESVSMANTFGKESKQGENNGPSTSNPPLFSLADVTEGSQVSSQQGWAESIFSHGDSGGYDNTQSLEWSRVPTRFTSQENQEAHGITEKPSVITYLPWSSKGSNMQDKGKYGNQNGLIPPISSQSTLGVTEGINHPSVQSMPAIPSDQKSSTSLVISGSSEMSESFHASSQFQTTQRIPSQEPKESVNTDKFKEIHEAQNTFGNTSSQYHNFDQQSGLTNHHIWTTPKSIGNIHAWSEQSFMQSSLNSNGKIEADSITNNIGSDYSIDTEIAKDTGEQKVSSGLGILSSRKASANIHQASYIPTSESTLVQKRPNSSEMIQKVPAKIFTNQTDKTKKSGERNESSISFILSTPRAEETIHLSTIQSIPSQGGYYTFKNTQIHGSKNIINNIATTVHNPDSENSGKFDAQSESSNSMMSSSLVFTENVHSYQQPTAQNIISQDNQNMNGNMQKLGSANAMSSMTQWTSGFSMGGMGKYGQQNGHMSLTTSSIFGANESIHYWNKHPYTQIISTHGGTDRERITPSFASSKVKDFTVPAEGFGGMGKAGEKYRTSTVPKMVQTKFTKIIHPSKQRPLDQSLSSKESFNNEKIIRTSSQPWFTKFTKFIKSDFPKPTKSAISLITPDVSKDMQFSGAKFVENTSKSMGTAGKK